ncbi:hypothetical protein [Magnetospirillum aberrantis]|uniref:Uncharacterized protein n=1 Tax=Magnetospirillum aberrantis SpK TaxID=908842 RepID=A0A7C9USS7_9PROT|nr:hypothetical protein [Magnetospirillum aberrantis]NFV79508.1 hypothetical protein [Magnetospirillum aberrantis SpK]
MRDPGRRKCRKPPKYPEQVEKFRLLLRSRHWEPVDLANALCVAHKLTFPSVYRWCRGEVKPTSGHLHWVLDVFGLTARDWDEGPRFLQEAIEKAEQNPVRGFVASLTQNGLYDGNALTTEIELVSLAGNYVAIRPSFNPSNGIIVSRLEISVVNSVSSFVHSEVTLTYTGAVLPMQGGYVLLVGKDIEKENHAIYFFDRGDDSQWNVDQMLGIRVGMSVDFRNSPAATNIALVRQDALGWQEDLYALFNAPAMGNDDTSLPKFISLSHVPDGLRGLLTVQTLPVLVPLKHPSRHS